MNPFDRIEILIEGEKLDARPVKFEYNTSGEVLKALEYETTCPKCGGLVIFGHNSEDEKIEEVYCEACSGVVNEPIINAILQPPQEPINIRTEGQQLYNQIDETKKSFPVSVTERKDNCAFQDVVELGLFNHLYVGA